MKLVFIIFLANQAFGAYDKKYIDLLPEKEKEEFLQRIARRILADIKVKEDNTDPTRDVSKQELDKHQEFIDKIFDEEAKNIAVDSDSDINVKPLPKPNKASNLRDHIDLTDHVFGLDDRKNDKSDYLSDKEADIRTDTLNKEPVDDLRNKHLNDEIDSPDKQEKDKKLKKKQVNDGIDLENKERNDDIDLPKERTLNALPVLDNKDSISVHDENQLNKEKGTSVPKDSTKIPVILASTETIHKKDEYDDKHVRIFRTGDNNQLNSKDSKILDQKESTDKKLVDKKEANQKSNDKTVSSTKNETKNGNSNNKEPNINKLRSDTKEANISIDSDNKTKSPESEIKNKSSNKNETNLINKQSNDPIVESKQINQENSKDNKNNGRRNKRRDINSFTVTNNVETEDSEPITESTSTKGVNVNNTTDTTTLNNENITTGIETTDSVTTTDISDTQQKSDINMRSAKVEQEDRNETNSDNERTKVQNEDKHLTTKTNSVETTDTYIYNTDNVSKSNDSVNDNLKIGNITNETHWRRINGINLNENQTDNQTDTTTTVDDLMTLNYIKELNKSTSQTDNQTDTMTTVDELTTLNYIKELNQSTSTVNDLQNDTVTTAKPNLNDSKIYIVNTKELTVTERVRNETSFTKLAARIKTNESDTTLTTRKQFEDNTTLKTTNFDVITESNQKLTATVKRETETTTGNLNYGLLKKKFQVTTDRLSTELPILTTVKLDVSPDSLTTESAKNIPLTTPMFVERSKLKEKDFLIKELANYLVKRGKNDNIKTEGQSLQSYSGMEHLKSFSNMNKGKEFQVFEVDQNQNPFELSKAVKPPPPHPSNQPENIEQPHYIPIYEYSPKNAFYNPVNRFGPNEDDVPSQITRADEEVDNEEFHRDYYIPHEASDRKTGYEVDNDPRVTNNKIFDVQNDPRGNKEIFQVEESPTLNFFDVQDKGFKANDMLNLATQNNDVFNDKSGYSVDKVHPLGVDNDNGDSNTEYGVVNDHVTNKKYRFRVDNSYAPSKGRIYLSNIDSHLQKSIYQLMNKRKPKLALYAKNVARTGAQRDSDENDSNKRFQIMNNTSKKTNITTTSQSINSKSINNDPLGNTKIEKDYKDTMSAIRQMFYEKKMFGFDAPKTSNSIKPPRQYLGDNTKLKSKSKNVADEKIAADYFFGREHDKLNAADNPKLRTIDLAEYIRDLIKQEFSKYKKGFSGVEAKSNEKQSDSKVIEKTTYVPDKPIKFTSSFKVENINDEEKITDSTNTYNEEEKPSDNSNKNDSEKTNDSEEKVKDSEEKTDNLNKNNHDKLTYTELLAILQNVDSSELIPTMERLVEMNLFSFKDVQILKTKKVENPNIDIHADVLKDMVQQEDNALKQFDWLKTTVNVLAAIQKISILSDATVERKFIHPSDFQLYSYLVYLHKSATHEAAENRIINESRRKQLPKTKNKKNKYITDKGLMNRVWLYRMLQENNENPIVNIENSKELKRFLESLQDKLYSLHTAILNISKITKYNDQNWFKNLKEIFIENNRDRSVEVLAHLTASRLFDLVESSSYHGLLENHIDYIKDNEKIVERTKEEFVFLIKLLNEIVDQ